MTLKISLTLCSLLVSLGWGQVDYPTYTRTDIHQDLEFLAQKVTRIHPVFLIDPNAVTLWETHLQEAQKKIKERMTQNEFYLIVAPLLASLRDGHTAVTCPYEQRVIYMKQKQGLSFPFAVDIQDRCIAISEYYGEDETLFQGSEELLAINGVKASEICETLRPLMGARGDAIAYGQIATSFRSLLWMRYGFEEDYTLEVKGDAGNIKHVTVPGIRNDQYLKNRERYQTNNRGRYDLSIDPNQSIAIMTLHSVADLEGFNTFAEQAFQRLADEAIDALIIDIRDNSGGRSVVVDALLGYLTDRAYSQYRQIDIRVSKNLCEHYRQQSSPQVDLIKDHPFDTLLSVGPQMTDPSVQEHRFRGRVVLLTNGRTYSGAATLAGVFKHLKLGTIVGEETGGTIEYYGDFWLMYLPHSGLQFHVSPKRFVQYGGSDMSRGVLPDVIIRDVDDAIMTFAFDLVRKHGTP